MKDKLNISNEFIKKTVDDIAKEYNVKITFTKEYCEAAFGKTVCDTLANFGTERKIPAMPKIIVSDMDKPGTIYVATEPQFIGVLKMTAYDILPAGVDIEFVPFRDACTENDAKINYCTEKDVTPCAGQVWIDIGHGATCIKCKEHNEYAEASGEFVCWSCRSGF
jgi:hypothetical protein